MTLNVTGTAAFPVASDTVQTTRVTACVNTVFGAGAHDTARSASTASVAAGSSYVTACGGEDAPATRMSDMFSITGAVVSCIMTSWIACAVLCDESVAVQCM